MARATSSPAATQELGEALPVDEELEEFPDVMDKEMKLGAEPMTAEPTTPESDTVESVTAEPTTPESDTVESVTAEPTTPGPDTVEPVKSE